MCKYILVKMLHLYTNSIFRFQMFSVRIGIICSSCNTSKRLLLYAKVLSGFGHNFPLFAAISEGFNHKYHCLLLYATVATTNLTQGQQYIYIYIYVFWCCCQ